MTSDRVILNWVEENNKSFKKVFPILPYLEDDDIIIDIDDDIFLPKDFIEDKTMNLDSNVLSAYSLFQKKMFDNWEKFVNDEIIRTCNDDRTYLYLIHMNGYELRPCTKWCVQ